MGEVNPKKKMWILTYKKIRHQIYNSNRAPKILGITRIMLMYSYEFFSTLALTAVMGWIHVRCSQMIRLVNLFHVSDWPQYGILPVSCGPYHTIQLLSRFMMVTWKANININMYLTQQQPTQWITSI
jgi:hypothetical protein